MYDGVILRWDVTTGKELPALSKHLSGAANAHVLPDGKTLLMGSQGFDVRLNVLDLRGGQ